MYPTETTLIMQNNSFLYKCNTKNIINIYQSIKNCTDNKTEPVKSDLLM